MFRLNPSPLPAIIWSLIITFLLCLPGTEFPKNTWLNEVWLIDKWIHIGLFLVLVFFWSWAFSGKQIGKGKQKTIFFKITLLSLIYGIIMEIVQRYFIPFRSFNYGDIAANGVGCFIGYIIAIRKYIKK